MNTADSDLLHGYEEIGKHLHMTKDAVKHRAKQEGIPTFKMGRIVCSRRSTLNAWLTNLEAAGRAHVEGGKPEDRP